MMPDFFAGPVVCNMGPLIGLARAGLAKLLTDIFPSMLVPQAVADELLAKDSPDQELIATALTLMRILPLASAMDPLLTAELDGGEAAVIQLAREQGINRVLIDEKKARKVASIIYRLEVKGTGALLIEAKKRGLVSNVGNALSDMASGGYFIGPQLRAECLRRAGE